MGQAEQLAQLRPWDNIVCITAGQGGVLNMRLCRLTPSTFLTPSSSCVCLHFRVAFFLARPDSRRDFFQIHLSGGTYVDLRVWGMREPRGCRLFSCLASRPATGFMGVLKSTADPADMMETCKHSHCRTLDGGCRIDR